MPKTFTDLARHALNGPTMGTRWSALFHMPGDFETTEVHAAMADAVAEVDRQMSIWKPESDLNRLNAAAPGEWVTIPEHLMKVLGMGLAIGQASGGPFDIGMGGAVAAWGFGVTEADETAINLARLTRRKPASDVLELDAANQRACKHADIRIDLDGIAKGFGVDRLAQTARQHGIEAGFSRSMESCARSAGSRMAEVGRLRSRNPTVTNVRRIPSSSLGMQPSQPPVIIATG